MTRTTGKRSILPKTVMVGHVPVGGASPISVQTMLSGRLPRDRDQLSARLKGLQQLGCDIIRTAAPDLRSVEDLPHLVSCTDMPVVADVHFDHRIALAALDTGVAKLRINPGNLGPEWKTLEVLHKASDNNIPIRVGINGGSLPKHLGGIEDKATAMVLAAEEELEIMDKAGFENAVFSLKASDIETTCRANYLFAQKYNYPLHLGVTEAGPLIEGVVKSAIAFSRLLSAGIGSTLRVSLTDSEENEVIAGRSILTSLGLAKGLTIISCPRCARATFDTHAFIRTYGDRIRSLGKNKTIAVMGCTVNGPDEAASADLGITGSGKQVLIFKAGKVIRECSVEEAANIFLEELEKL